MFMGGYKRIAEMPADNYYNNLQTIIQEGAGLV
jgi:hypothetical protein